MHLRPDSPVASNDILIKHASGEPAVAATSHPLSEMTTKAPPTPPQKAHSTWDDCRDLLFCVGGIYFCYLYYGYLQERIFKTPRGETGERFQYPMFLLFIQTIVNASLGASILFYNVQVRRTVKISKMPWKTYFLLSSSYIAAMLCSNWSLNYVAYPTQVLGKSCKMIPVMLMGIVVLGKRYKLREYVVVLMITLGICSFMYFRKSTQSKDAGENTWTGLFLLFASLTLDGFTGPSQEKQIKKHGSSTHEMMACMNVCSMFLVVTPSLVSGRFYPALMMSLEHSDVMVDILLFSVMSAFGQNFIFYTLFRFNALALTTITTTRKFFTILGSVLWFGHDLHFLQWYGVFMVFAGLGANTAFKFKDSMDRERNNTKAT